jgi:hypothetical protein
VKENEAADPANIRLLGADRHVADADGVADTVEEPRLARPWGVRLGWSRALPDDSKILLIPIVIHDPEAPSESGACQEMGGFSAERASEWKEILRGVEFGGRVGRDSV